MCLYTVVGLCATAVVCASVVVNRADESDTNHASDHGDADMRDALRKEHASETRGSSAWTLVDRAAGASFWDHYDFFTANVSANEHSAIHGAIVAVHIYSFKTQTLYEITYTNGYICR